MNIYIICPVRNRTGEEDEKIKAYVVELEEKGHTVREPSRDTDQNDEIGLRITQEHEEDIIWADEVHVWWNPKSKGNLWDMAQARMAKRFMPEKKIVLLNVNSIKVTPEKSYTNVVLATHYGLSVDSTLQDLKESV